MRLAMIAGVLALAGMGQLAKAGVVINEIFYNAPDEGQVQWVELHNDGDAPVEIGGWVLRKVEGQANAVKHQQLYKLPEMRIAARAFIVVANDVQQFRAASPRAAAIGPMEQGLARGGGRIELVNGKGERQDLARYDDTGAWPVSADGSSASLERICPSSAGDVGDNWAGSPMPVAAPKASGTPGQKNASYSAVLPPVVKVVGNGGNNHFNVAPAALYALELYGNGGNDVFVGAGAQAATIYGGPGEDEFVLGNGNLGPSASNVRVFGEGGSDALTLDDSLSPFDLPWTINGATGNNQTDRTVFLGLNAYAYGGAFERVKIRGGPAAQT